VAGEPGQLYPIGWREPVSAGTVRDLLDSRVGGEVSVTAGKAGVFLYAATADGAAAAEGVAREVLAQQGLAADTQLERWDPSRRAWLPPGAATAAELPSGQEGGPGRKRRRGDRGHDRRHRQRLFGAR
jgi:hypothetical protein